MSNKEFFVRHGLVVNNTVLTANVITNKVGIGTNTAAHTLDVIGDANISLPQLFVAGSNVLDTLRTTYATTNAAYDSSNSNWAVQNAVYDLTNTIYASANSNWTVQNAIYDLTNTVYASSNSNWEVQNAVYDLTNTVYASSNSNWQVQNAVYDLANTIYASSNSNWVVQNAIYDLTNTVYASSNSNWEVQNLVYATVNANYIMANAAYNTLNAAYNTANAIYASQNIDFATANAAYMVANAAYANANTVAISANGWANTVGLSANSYAGYMTNSANIFADATYLKLAGGTITGDLSITGNVFLLGNATSIAANNVTINDPLIYLAANNSQSDILDIGFIGNYSNGTANLHTGLFRDHSSKQYYLFVDAGGPEPTETNDIVPYANGMINAVLNTDLLTSNIFLGGANAIHTISGAFDKANAAYNNANVGFAAANAYSDSVGVAGNNYASILAANNAVGANAWSNTVGFSVNTYASILASNNAIGANAWANTVGTSGNAYTDHVGLSANTYASILASNNAVGANTWANTVGTAGNNYTDHVGLSANTYASILAANNALAGNNYTNSVGVAGNNYTNAVGIAGNNYTNSVGAAGNSYTQQVGTAGNNYTDTVGTAANNYASILAANNASAGNNYTNSVGAAGNSYTQQVGTAGNNYTNSVGVAGNNYASILAANNALAGNNYTDTVGIAGNNYMLASVTAANNYMLATTASDRDYTNTSTTAANNYTNAVGTSGNSYALTTATDIGTAGNNYTNTVGAAGNSYTQQVGIASNNYASILAANNALAGNNYTNSVGIAGNNYTNSVGVAGNNYTNSVGVAGNSYALTTATDIGIAGNNYASILAANNALAGNNYTNAVGTSGNSYALTTATDIGAAGNNYTNFVGASSNSYAQQVGAAANAYTSATYYSKSGGLISGDVGITGNLTISGTTTYANTQQLQVGDNIITLNADLPLNVTPIDDAGIEVNRGDKNSNATFLWMEATGQWGFTSNNAQTISTFVASNTLVEQYASSINSYITQVGTAGNNYANTLASNNYVSATFATLSNVAIVYNTSNVAFDTANAAYAAANNVAPQVTPSYNTANAAFVHANAAYNSANSNWTVQNALYTTANAGYDTSNAAFAKANNALANVADVTFAGNLKFAGSVTANNGFLSTYDYRGPFGDGIVVDYNYSTSTGRISVGANDSLTFYNGGVGTIPILTLSQYGFIGIGNTNPTYPVTISANGAPITTLAGAIFSAEGSENGPVQLNIRNAGTAPASSGDLIVTADDGTDTKNYIDLGINGSNYAQPGWTINGARDGYLYSSNTNLAIGTANTTAYKSVSFFVGGTLAGNEVLRIQDSLNGANVGIGRTDPSYKLDVLGTINASNILLNGAPITAGGGASVNVGATSPALPTEGNLWWDTNSARMYIYYNDGDSSQWVDASPASSYLPNTSVTPATYGGATQIPVIVVDAQGRINVAANVAVQGMDYAYANTVGTAGNNYSLSLVTAANNWANTKVDSITSNGTRIWANSTVTSGIEVVNIDLATTSVTAASYGSSTNIPVITVDTYGRVTYAANIAVQGMDYAYANNIANSTNAWANTKTSGGAYVGNNGQLGSGFGDIFRVHSNTLSTNAYVNTGNNAIAAGPITIAVGQTLTINAGASVVIV